MSYLPYRYIEQPDGTKLRVSLRDTEANAVPVSVGVSSPALGQALMAASIPVVVASDQTAVPISGSLTIASGSVTSAQGTAAAQTSAEAWPVRLVSGTDDRAATVDTATNALNTIEYEHHEIHNGSSFTCHYNNDCTNIGEMTMIAFNTPDTTKWIHVVFEAQSTAGAYMAVYEAADLDVDEGTALTIWNRDRNSATQSVVTSIETVPVANRATSYTEAQAAGATLSTASELMRHYLGAAAAGADVAGGARATAEFILKRNTQYAFVVVSTSADDNTHNITLSWYEHTNKTS